VLFIKAETKAAEPFIPLDLFRSPIVAISMLALFFIGFAMLAGITFIPLFFQGVLGLSATNSGAFLTPMSLGMVVASILSGQAMARIGGHYRIQGLIGLALMGLGVALMSRMDVNTSYGQAVFFIVLMGIGLGITLPLFTIAVQNAVPYRVMGIATSTSAFIRAIGGTLGLAVLGSVMSSSFASNLNHDVTSDVKAVLEPGQLSSMAHNPQVLVIPEAQEHCSCHFLGGRSIPQRDPSKRAYDSAN